MDVERSVLSSFRGGIVAIRQDGTVAYLNAIGARILGASSPNEGDDLRPRASENPFYRLLTEALSMNYLPTRVEAEFPVRDGDRQFIGFTLAELKDGDRRVGVCAFFKDLTQVEMAEENENLEKRLLMLGHMAANFAHEIRNPIAGIGVHCSILKSRLAGQDKLVSSIDMIAGEIAKVEGIIRECLSYVRPAVPGAEPVDVDRLVDGIVERFRALHPETTFQVARSGSRPLQAEADAGLLEQAVTNIVSNAVDACGAGGRVDLSLGVSRHYSDTVKLGRRADSLIHGHSGREEEYVRIGIRDNGPGISAEIQEKIFVPFFTTKKTGTGIGLAMAQKIIHAHGGVLDLVSEPGKGASFVIKIPTRRAGGGPNPRR